MSVQAVVSALKLKLPLLWAKAGTTPNAATTSATQRIMADFIRVLLKAGLRPAFNGKTTRTREGCSALFR